MNCILCNNKVGLKSVRLKDGRICKSCASKLPSLFLKNAPYIQKYSLKRAMFHVAENMKEFCATASYGKLHIDSVHGFFCIADKLTKEGKPKSGNNVFSIYNLTEIGLVCNSPRVEHSGVVVDVEFSCHLTDPDFSIRTTIKKYAKCKYNRVDSTHVEWDEPGDLSMFRSMFNQMLSYAFEKINQMLCSKTVYEFELEKARAIFMLPENYTEVDLKKARRLMMKVYHPDKAGEDDVTREAQIINEAHDLLKSHLEQHNQATKGDRTN